MRPLTIVCLLLTLSLYASAQQKNEQKYASLPSAIDKNARYLFYLHGGVVTILGDSCINRGAPEWGPYEYLIILDSLQQRGFKVISERRFESISDSTYAVKLCKQVDTLLKAGVPVSNIVIISASAGWTISFRASAWLKKDGLQFVKMGGCREYDVKEVGSSVLRGHFLSIIEKTDSHGTCADLFKDQKQLSSYKEIELITGLDHGFFYKARKVWMDPLIAWFTKK